MSVDSGGELQAKSNRGPKQKEENPNIFCRLCKKFANSLRAFGYKENWIFVLHESIQALREGK